MQCGNSHRCRRTVIAWWRNHGPMVCFVLIIVTFAVNLLVAFDSINDHRRRQQPWWHQGSGGLFSTTGLHQNLRGQNFASSQKDPWHRILREKSALCPSNRMSKSSSVVDLDIGQRVQNRTRNRDTGSSSSLTFSEPPSPSLLHLHPMGFFDRLRNLTQNEMIMSSFSCQPAPRSKACSIHQYSVIILSTGRDLRRVVTTIMSFQSYPSVSNINLILLSGNRRRNGNGAAHSVSQDLLDDRKYGARILRWKDKGIVNVITREKSDSLWDAIDLVQIGDANGNGGSDNGPDNGVLWIDADRPTKDWNGTLLKRRLKLWKGQPKSLVIQQTMSNVGLQPLEGEHESGTSTHNNPVSCAIDLHGLMMHPSYLCYMQHPATKELRTYIKSSSRDHPANYLSNNLDLPVDIWSVGIFLFFAAETYLVHHGNNREAYVHSDQTDLNSLNLLETKQQITKNHAGVIMDSGSHRRVQSIIDYFGGCSCSSIVHVPKHQLQRCSS